ncbi:hypothetical protein [Amycolatopsis sp. NPDC051716]|uniref:hypothetical protein n=1 Tax=Amycolatopsis sp. NPDC051716 TaxID=3155804 RepID=UPI00344261EB
MANQVGHGSGAGRTADGGAGTVRAREPISITRAEYVDPPTCKKNCSSSGLAGSSANVRYASACSPAYASALRRPANPGAARSRQKILTPQVAPRGRLHTTGQLIMAGP